MCLPEWAKHGWECLVEHGAQGESLGSMEPHSGQWLPDLDVYQNHRGGGLIKICSSPGPLLETVIPLVLEQRPETYIFKAPQANLMITPDLRPGSGRHSFLRHISRTRSGILIISISWAPLYAGTHRHDSHFADDEASSSFIHFSAIYQSTSEQAVHCTFKTADLFFDTLVKSYKPFHHKTVPVKKILHDFRGFMEHSSRACPRTSG